MQLEASVAKELADIIKEQYASHAEQIKSLETRLAIIEARKPEKGERGEKGDSIIGPAGPKGEKGETIIGPQGEPGKDGIGIAVALIDRDDNLVLTMTDGTTKSLGRIRGADGAAGPQGPPGIDGKDGAGPSRGRHRGPWKHDEPYHLDDSVSSGNGIWIALVEDAKGRPGDSKDWQLAVRAGRNGKDGERGPPGPMGPAGKDSKYA